MCNRSLTIKYSRIRELLIQVLTMPFSSKRFDQAAWIQRSWNSFWSKAKKLLKTHLNKTFHRLQKL